MSRIIIETKENIEIIIRGDVDKILSHRRAKRLLMDVLECRVNNGSVEVYNITDFQRTIDIIKRVAETANCEVEYSTETDSIMQRYVQNEENFANFSKDALDIRNNICNKDDFAKFKNSLIEKLPSRTLYPLQLLAAYHLAFSQNACNFSVPGAGKTSIVYGAYAYLKSLEPSNPKYVNKLVIIGPLSSFSPWETEYEECFGRTAPSKRLAGGMSLEDKKQYLYEENDDELILLSYQSVISLAEELRYYLRKNRVMVVLDEAHKIKNYKGGIIAESVLSVAPDCSARVVLTGTPAPNGYEDLYNLYHFIWPGKNVIRYNPGQLKDMSRNDSDYRIDSLINNISPYFIRIKKSDLNIPPAIIHPPIVVPMKNAQRRLYDYIEGRAITDIVDSGNNAIGEAIRRARIIRMMQAATNPALLKKPLSEFTEIESPNIELAEDDNTLIVAIGEVCREIPAKFEKALELVSSILQEGEKVIVWACYIQTIEELSMYFSNQGIDNRILYGGTPVAGDGLSDEDEGYEVTREAIIKEFNSPDSSFSVIIANPFAVAESISLHKACHNAIYLERSFNAAHFIQSKDRIHRYGMPEGVETHYYYIVSEDSIDETINDRLTIKENRLNEIMESMPIPLFKNIEEDEGDEDIKALMRDYARRIKTQ